MTSAGSPVFKRLFRRCLIGHWLLIAVSIFHPKTAPDHAHAKVRPTQRAVHQYNTMARYTSVPMSFWGTFEVSDAVV